MQQIELELAGGGVLTVSLRASLDAMPAVKERPLVLVVPGGGYDHVSPREGAFSFSYIYPRNFNC